MSPLTCRVQGRVHPGLREMDEANENYAVEQHQEGCCQYLKISKVKERCIWQSTLWNLTVKHAWDVLMIGKCIAGPVTLRGRPLAPGPALWLTTYFPPHCRPKFHKPTGAEEKANTYCNVHTLDEAKHIVDGTQFKCQISHELRKKEPDASPCTVTIQVIPC